MPVTFFICFIIKTLLEKTLEFACRINPPENDGSAGGNGGKLAVMFSKVGSALPGTPLALRLVCL
jgi:hypothetical protein